MLLHSSGYELFAALRLPLLFFNCWFNVFTVNSTFNKTQTDQQ